MAFFNKDADLSKGMYFNQTNGISKDLILKQEDLEVVQNYLDKCT